MPRTDKLPEPQVVLAPVPCPPALPSPLTLLSPRQGVPLLEAATKTTLGKGRPLHHILSILHASQSQAEGVTGGSCLGEWAAASLPWEPLISGLCGGLSSHPGCPSTDRLRKGHERGPGLLSVVDHDPGKYHLAFLCVF